MSNKLIIMAKARSILRYYTQGVSKKMISEKTGVTRNTVKKYIRQFIAMDKPIEELDKLTDTELERLFMTEQQSEPGQKYKDLLSFFPEMEKALRRKGATRDKQWNLYIAMHPDGYKPTQFKEHYNLWSKKVNSSMHLEHKAGDKIYVDYAGDRLEYIDETTGEVITVEIFVAILGSSQLTYVEASSSQEKENFISSCESALYYFGGAPQAIVTDNLKSAVTKSDKYEPTLNEMFRDFVGHYNMTALPAGPYKPKHKALVEGAVKIIYGTIYDKLKEKTFYSLQELNKAIREALEEHNNRLLKGRTYSRRQLFEEIEKQELQPLPEYRYQTKRKKIVTVSKNNHVCLTEDKHYYSVPYRYVGKKVTILYSQNDVEVYHRYERIAVHQRKYNPYGYTTTEDHLASQHRFMSDWNPEHFIQRAAFIGNETKEYITAILDKKQHPEQAYKSCQGILSFAVRAGGDRLNKACSRAMHFNDYSYNTIRTIIEKKLDMQDIDTEEHKKKMPPHNNIRGNDYYK
jgi:transposase